MNCFVLIQKLQSSVWKKREFHYQLQDYRVTSWGYRASEQKAQPLWVHQGWMWQRVFFQFKSIFTSVLSKATGFFPQVMVDFLQLLCPFRNLYLLFSFGNSAGPSLKFFLYPVSDEMCLYGLFLSALLFYLPCCPCSPFYQD